jgi:hypothetical protein
MFRLLPAVLTAAALVAAPVSADEFTETLESALKAYGEGDITGARQDLDYAAKLLTALKAEALAKFLPEPPAGWTRSEPGDGIGVRSAVGMGSLPDNIPVEIEAVFELRAPH